MTNTALKAAGKLAKQQAKTVSAAFKRDREKRSRPLKLILQQQREGGGGGGGAAGQPGPYCAFGTDLCRVGPAKKGWSQPGAGLGAAGGVCGAALHGSSCLAPRGRIG